jgi:hypothetical protein
MLGFTLFNPTYKNSTENDEVKEVAETFIRANGFIPTVPGIENLKC